MLTFKPLKTLTCLLSTHSSLEMSIRTLNLHGVELPQKVPELPPLPTDFNFATKSDESAA